MENALYLVVEAALAMIVVSVAILIGCGTLLVWHLVSWVGKGMADG